MKHIKSFKIFEQINEQIEIDISSFLDEIGLRYQKEKIVDWWFQNRGHIKIYHFDFSSTHPILGVILSENEIAINKRNIPSHIKLFVALHESRHCDQHAQGIFNPQYYEPVVQGNKSEFLKNYQKLEQDANDFAINSMRKLGFDLEMNREERMLRGNESVGYKVYDMMKHDIERLRPTDMIDLLKKQIF